jgi:hypothetical protein
VPPEARRRDIPAVAWICSGVNALAAVVLALLLAGGTEAETDPATRAQYVAQHLAVWRVGWALWICAAISLVTFYNCWASRLPRVARLAVLVATAGMVMDVSAETIYMAWIPAASVTESIHLHAVARNLTGLGANGLYTVAGIWLTLLTANLGGAVRVLLWAAWAAGAGLSAGALLAFPLLMGVASGVLFITFCPAVLMLGCRLR